MKRTFALLFSCVLLTFYATAQTEDASSTSTSMANADMPAMTFQETEIDYGIIEQNAEPYREFHFTNTGTAPLVIKNAKGSCGCTVPEWPKEPIPAGESNVIKVRYATNRIGKFSKTVTLTTNDEKGQHLLRIKGEVLKPKPEEGVPSAPANGLTGGTGSNDK